MSLPFPSLLQRPLETSQLPTRTIRFCHHAQKHHRWNVQAKQWKHVILHMKRDGYFPDPMTNVLIVILTKRRFGVMPRYDRLPAPSQVVPTEFVMSLSNKQVMKTKVPVVLHSSDGV